MPPPILTPEADALVFQCIDLVTQDCIVLSEDSASESVRSYPSSDGSGSYKAPMNSADESMARKAYQILLFGSDALGRSVCLQVEDFRPYFYIQIPSGLGKSAIRTLDEWIRTSVPESIQHRVKITQESHKTLMNYNGGKSAQFLRVEVPSQAL